MWQQSWYPWKENVNELLPYFTFGDKGCLGNKHGWSSGMNETWDSLLCELCLNYSRASLQIQRGKNSFVLGHWTQTKCLYQLTFKVPIHLFSAKMLWCKLSMPKGILFSTLTLQTYSVMTNWSCSGMGKSLTCFPINSCMGRHVYRHTYAHAPLCIMWHMY